MHLVVALSVQRESFTDQCFTNFRIFVPVVYITKSLKESSRVKAMTL